MRNDQIALVQQSWEQVAPIADAAARLFYRRLFELDPSLQSLFNHTNMDEQRKKLLQMITVAVRGLPRVHELLPALEAMGRRHVDYGVKDEHYDTVGAALLWTLENGLGAAYTPEVREAWTLTYGTLASVMKAGAAQKLAA